MRLAGLHLSLGRHLDWAGNMSLVRYFYRSFNQWFKTLETYTLFKISEWKCILLYNPSFMQISLLVPQEIEKIQLPPNTKAIRDLRILPNRLALLASLGRKLSLFRFEWLFIKGFSGLLWYIAQGIINTDFLGFSMTSNNFVLQYNLPVIPCTLILARI